ncbi:multiple epidermal growth factor-like domains protein 10 [Physella acuta]|uniref:multiple epidermal growth factor-like domains protein 10 n=1 Tax=Physella acuta TaxID=109671 RepID=UPI0027DD1B4C|nr:multiple epidermal growth factor-like domains protein 10 [Physella acuta]
MRMRLPFYRLITRMRIVFLAVSCFVFDVSSVNVLTWSTTSNTYKCNCVTGQYGGHTPCLDGQCSTWWFGPACQYQNLLNDNYTTDVNKNLYDGRDDTCVSATDSINITFKNSYLFTWLRFTVLDAGSNKDSFSLTFKNNTPDWTIPCNKLNTNVVNNRTTDVWCDMNQTTNALKLTWNKPITICSLYISGGRNLAYNQSTAQSSTYQENVTPFVSALAVDGDIDGVFTHNSCTHTSADEKNGAPYWNITFSGAYYINRCVLYNRWDDNGVRLRQFKLEMLDDHNKVIAEHHDRSNVNQPLYAVTTPSVLVKSLRVTATYDSGYGKFVTLCEFEIYGDSICELGKFGLECEKTCNCATDEACFVATGGCPSGCKAGYYGEACDRACVPHTWGISCNQSCNDRCIDNTCNRFNGDCDKGCKVAHQPPACTQACHETYYGTNCSQRCSPNCNNSLCHPVNGHCLSCYAGSEGDFCDQHCHATYYGTNCSQRCSPYCTNSLCHPVNGHCLFCDNGSVGDFCDQPCHETYYGTNCSQRCSPNCNNSLCHPVNGHCLSCYAGSEGDFCDQHCHATYYGTNCSQRCSPYCTNSLCHPVNGHCLFCDNGSVGDFCDQPCHETYYGTNCSQRCSPNCNNSLCHPVNGHCLSCYAGSEGDFCDQPCHETYYGTNCSQRCSPNCTNSLCHPFNGHCLSCKDGSEGDFCDQTCDPYHYGKLCELNCSISCFQSKCDSVSGQCEKCYPGSTGKFCQNEKDQPNERAEGIGIGVAIGVVVTALLFLITAVLLHRIKMWSWRKNDKIKEEKHDHTPDSKLESEQHKIYTEAIETEEVNLQVNSSSYANHNVHTYDVINLQDVEKSDYRVFNT